MAMRITSSGPFLQRYFGMIFGGIWMVVGIPITIGGIVIWQDEQRFANEAVKTEGLVLARKIVTKHSSSGSSGSSTSTEHWVSYRFLPPNGITHEGSSKTDKHVWNGLQEQGPVTVAYLPNDPANNRVAGDPDWFGAGLMAGLGGLFSLAGAGIFLFSLSRRLSSGRLMREGMSAEAIVTTVEPTNFSINRVPQWIIRYRYHDYRGREHTGKSPYLAPEEAQEWKEGNTGKVKYNREKSHKSLWIGNE